MMELVRSGGACSQVVWGEEIRATCKAASRIAASVLGTKI